MSFTGSGDELPDVAVYYCNFADMTLDLRGKKYVANTKHLRGHPPLRLLCVTSYFAGLRSAEVCSPCESRPWMPESGCGACCHQRPHAPARLHRRLAMGRQEMALVAKVSSAAYCGRQGARLQWGPVSAKHTPLAMQKEL